VRILEDKEFGDYTQRLQEERLVMLVNDLDGVRLSACFLFTPSTCYRLSMLSILPDPVSRDVYKNSGTYAELG
jgi:hypothetical protein